MNDTTPEQAPEDELTSEEAAPYASGVNSQAGPAEPAGQPVAAPTPPLSRLARFKRSLRATIRWISVALLGLLVGLAVMAYPVLHAEAALKTVEKERDQAQFTLTVQNKVLESLQVDQSRLVVLRTLSEVRAAKLALDNNDDVNLPLFLDKAVQVMNTIPPSLLKTQQSTVTKIQQKLASAQQQAKNNTQATQPDLDQQLSDLIENLRNLDALLNPTP